jgi:hypothetical protein
MKEVFERMVARSKYLYDLTDRIKSKGGRVTLREKDLKGDGWGQTPMLHGLNFTIDLDLKAIKDSNTGKLQRGQREPWNWYHSPEEIMAHEFGHVLHAMEQAGFENRDLTREERQTLVPEGQYSENNDAAWNAGAVYVEQASKGEQRGATHTEAQGHRGPGAPTAPTKGNIDTFSKEPVAPRAFR